jgi:hypothetical protein
LDLRGTPLLGFTRDSIADFLGKVKHFVAAITKKRAKKRVKNAQKKPTAIMPSVFSRSKKWCYALKISL